MSCLSKFTKIVYAVRIFCSELNFVTTYEYEDAEQAEEEALALVSYYVESTGLHHEAEIFKKIVPIYL